MTNYIIQKDQLYDTIKENTFVISDTLTVRASESSDSQEVENTVVFPGGLQGILSVWLAASTAYGFQIDPSKFTKTFIEITKQKIEGSPQFLTMLKERHDSLNISLEHIQYIETNSSVLKHTYIQYEGGIFLIKGANGLRPNMQVMTDRGRVQWFVCIFHQTQVNKLNRLLAKQCIVDKSVSLLDGQDEEYLYEVVSDTADEFFYESIRYFCKGLPLYLLEYKDKGVFDTTEQGMIEL